MLYIAFLVVFYLLFCIVSHLSLIMSFKNCYKLIFQNIIIIFIYTSIPIILFIFIIKLYICLIYGDLKLCASIAVLFDFCTYFL